MHIAFIYSIGAGGQYLITLSNRLYFHPDPLLQLYSLAVNFLLEPADNSLDVLLHCLYLITIQSLLLAGYLYLLVDVLERLPEMGAMMRQTLAAEEW